MSDWYADGTSGHQGEASEAAEPGRRYKTDRAWLLVSASRRGGMTVAELRTITQWHHGAASSALSNLHRQGRLARLVQQRDGCGVYVTPANVWGRDTVPHRSWPKVDTLTRERIEQAVDSWWLHAVPNTRGSLVDHLCRELGVAT